ncbi:hypothetical protein O7626_19460 [Micromonospora sp. WMMD1102]|uniref:hypothetical protein n=1 Tax=Micromonospora sp. WMMD1102 TaxID=3016105 RepID=UPI0024158456|nr:hypothetical protein [Micromonospora sp. WMMD1102]MDG4788092.1 hypothetical protein [Micromonospora sp. WMMD1102]
MTNVIESGIRAATAGEQEIQAATREHREAADLLAALEERVRAGDPDIRPAELRDARELVEFAALRVDAARRRADEAMIAARHEMYAQMGQAVRQLTLDDGAVVAAYGAAVTSLRHLYAVVEADQEQLEILAPQAGAVLEEAQQHGETNLLHAAGLARSAYGDSAAKFAVIDPDGRRRTMWRVPPVSAVLAALNGALADDPGLARTMRLEHGETAQTAASAAHQTARAYPQLAPGSEQEAAPVPAEPVGRYRIEAFRTGRDGEGRSYRDPVNEVIAGVRFAAGIGTVTTDTDEGRRALAYFRRKGYPVEQVDAAPAGQG